VRGEATGMDDALGNAFVVEVEDLLAQDEVLKERRAPQPGLESFVVVSTGCPAAVT